LRITAQLWDDFDPLVNERACDLQSRRYKKIWNALYFGQKCPPPELDEAKHKGWLMKAGRYEEVYSVHATQVES